MTRTGQATRCHRQLLGSILTAVPALPGRAVLTVVRALRDDHGDAEVVEADPAAQQLVHRLQRDAGLRARCQPTAPPAPAARAPPPRRALPSPPARPAPPPPHAGAPHLQRGEARRPRRLRQRQRHGGTARPGPALPRPQSESPALPRGRASASGGCRELEAGSWRPGPPREGPRGAAASNASGWGRRRLGKERPRGAWTALPGTRPDMGGVGPGWESPGVPPERGAVTLPRFRLCVGIATAPL